MVALANKNSARLDCSRTRIAADAGHRGRIYATRMAHLRAHSSRRATGDQQKLRQRISAAPPHSHCTHYAICDSAEQVRDALPHFHTPIVVKADGLAAGKGVVIAKSKDEASTAANEMLSGRMLGEAGSRVVLEEFLQGDELSFLVVSDGERVAPLVAAQDHKRVGDGDTGPNTGGMGAYTTRTIVDDQMRDWLITHIARPVVAGMKAEGAGV